MAREKGYKHTEESKRRMSKAMKGHIVTEETRRKISESRKGRFTGENSPSWKGDKASFKAIHSWISHNKPREYFCTICNESVRLTHFANISGEYKRDFDDYIELCPECHVLFDKLTGNKQPVSFKKVICPDCGKTFEVEMK